MDTNALKTVVMVARLGSLAAAARSLDLDPSSVSRTVAAVEASLGARLFRRSTRRLSVTDQGAAWLEKIAPLLDGLEAAAEDIRHEQSALTGTLRMTASVAYTEVVILPRLRSFRDRFPGLTLDLLPTDRNVDLNADGIDLAIRLAPAPQGDLISTRLSRTRYHVCASPAWIKEHGRPESPHALAGLDCVRFSMPGYRSHWRFRRAGEPDFEVAVTGSLLVSGALTLRSAARDGLGPSLLADWLTAHDRKEGRLVNLFPDYDCTATDFDTGAFALYPSRSWLPRKVRTMIDFLREYP